MKIDCVHGLLKLGVTVYDGVCDSADICHHKPCEYFDATEDGTACFMRARDYYTTIEGKLETERNPDVHLSKRRPAEYATHKPKRWEE